MTSLDIWTVYDHPSDFPHAYVARRWMVDADGARATDDHMLSADLDALRRRLEAMGLVHLDRSPGDDAKIMETWL